MGFAELSGADPLRRSVWQFLFAPVRLPAGSYNDRLLAPGFTPAANLNRDARPSPWSSSMRSLPQASRPSRPPAPRRRTFLDPGRREDLGTGDAISRRDPGGG